ncbi:MAG: Hpt domain-containing protein [Opitutaceae bacterium]|jgi:HPt (histidine-containing phosphotransfer) domain-containing protein
MSPLPIIDLEAIENLRALSPDDGDVFLKEILGIFIEDTPVRIAELHAHRTSGDATAFARAAHSIKGSSSNVGASELRSIAEKLEHHSRQHGIEGSDEQVAELEAAFKRASTSLQKYITR